MGSLQLKTVCTIFNLLKQCSVILPFCRTQYARLKHLIIIREHINSYQTSKSIRVCQDTFISSTYIVYSATFYDTDLVTTVLSEKLEIGVYIVVSAVTRPEHMAE